ncbi:Replication initiation protein OS=Streptomyces microflavus OX=1919 GN=G3I39_26200 PE=4 SV=1 [Streptomyces microflavus]
MTTTAAATAAGLGPGHLGDLLRVAGSPASPASTEQLRRTGGYSQPIHLTGAPKTIDRATGTLLHHYSTDTEPGGQLRIACGNRRASRCPACAWTYAGDTYHLIRAGLTGDPDKGTPTDHPGSPPGLRHPDGPLVRSGPQPARQPHLPLRHPAPRGRPGTGHTARPRHVRLRGGSAVEQPRLRPLALLHDLPPPRNRPQRRTHPKAAREQSKVSFGKVAEYQKRGAVHFHAVIRFDGPEGPDTPPPAWATLDLLDDAIRAAAARVEVVVPARSGSRDQRRLDLRWGTQLDVQPIGAFGNGEDLTEQAVASYVAKYATKAAETTGTVDHRIGNKEALVLLDVPEHPRRLIEACLDLHHAYPGRKLRDWAHMLGFRGHFSTKSRAYSTTLGALRQVRADYRAAEQRAALGLPDPDDHPEATTLTLAHWAYAGNGHTPGESWLAANIHRDIQHNRETAREHRAELEETGEC